MDTVPITVNGAKALRQELTHLKDVERPRIIDAIQEARAHGDLKENAEYHAAKEEQGFIEARIRDLESKISRLQIIDISALMQDGRVVFGATIELLNLQENTTIRYQIVGEDEANVDDHKISFNAPIARALLGKEEGDEVEIIVPKGVMVYEIIAVHYLP